MMFVGAGIFRDEHCKAALIAFLTSQKIYRSVSLNSLMLQKYDIYSFQQNIKQIIFISK